MGGRNSETVTQSEYRLAVSAPRQGARGRRTLAAPAARRDIARDRQGRSRRLLLRRGHPRHGDEPAQPRWRPHVGGFRRRAIDLRHPGFVGLPGRRADGDATQQPGYRPAADHEDSGRLRSCEDAPAKCAALSSAGGGDAPGF